MDDEDQFAYIYDTSLDTSLDSLVVAAASVTCPPLKVTLLGESAVGKTSIYQVAAHGGRSGGGGDDGQLTPTRPTVGVDMFTLTVAEHNVRMQLWDTAGMERYAPISSVYTRDTSAILLVYDLTRPETFDRLETRWMPLITDIRQRRTKSGRLPPLVFIVGNKSDRLGGDHLVDTHSEAAWASANGAVAHVVTTVTSYQSVRALLVDTVARAMATHLHELTPYMDTGDNQAPPITEDMSLSVFDAKTMQRHEDNRRRQHRQRKAMDAKNRDGSCFSC